MHKQGCANILKRPAEEKLTLVTVTFNPRPAVSSHLGQLPQLLLLLLLLLLGHLLLHLGSHLHSLSGLWRTNNESEHSNEGQKEEKKRTGEAHLSVGDVESFSKLGKVLVDVDRLQSPTVGCQTFV